MAFRGPHTPVWYVVPAAIALLTSLASAQSRYPDGVTAPGAPPLSQNRAARTPPSQNQPARRAEQQTKPIQRKRSAAALQERSKRNHKENIITILAAGREAGSTQFADNIAHVFDNIRNNKLRVRSLLGQGSAKNIIDMLQRKNVDIAIVDQGTLIYLKKKDAIIYGDVGNKINYITKLSNAELHIYARDNKIKNLEDLRGKTINCLKEGSATAMMCETIFQALKIDAKIAHNDVDRAHRDVMDGKIAAAAFSAPVPAISFKKFRAQKDLHFIPVSKENVANANFSQVQSRYLPARLRHEDYPAMIPEGKSVPTIATSSLLVVYAWPSKTQRYRYLQKFVRLFFSHIDAFRDTPNHPRWNDVNLAAEVPGWTRFPVAEAWLKRKRTALRRKFGTQEKFATRAIIERQTNKDESAKSETNEQGPVESRINESEVVESKTTEKEATAQMKAFNKFLDDLSKKGAAPKNKEQRKVLYAQFLQWWEMRKSRNDH